MLESALRELEAQLRRMTAPERAAVALAMRNIMTGLAGLGPISLSGKTGRGLMGAIGMAAAQNKSPAAFLKDAGAIAKKVGPHVELLVASLS